MTDLDRLIEAVEAGDRDSFLAIMRAMAEKLLDDGGRYWSVYDTKKAFDGSLDAAKRLHDALLPGWVWNVVDSETTVWPAYPGDPKNYQDGYSEGNPARAWLLAILRAVKAREGK